jgi:hypothetical protein
MSLELSSKSQKYIDKNKIKFILIDSTFIEEPCTEIYDPSIVILKNEDLDSIKDLDSISNGDLTLYLSKEFIKVFGKLNNYKLDTNRVFRSKLILSNVDPIIKNTCRTD